VAPEVRLPSPLPSVGGIKDVFRLWWLPAHTLGTSGGACPLRAVGLPSGRGSCVVRRFVSIITSVSGRGFEPGPARWALGTGKPIVQPATRRRQGPAEDGVACCRDRSRRQMATSLARRCSCSNVVAGRSSFSWAARGAGTGKGAPTSSAAVAGGSFPWRTVTRIRRVTSASTRGLGGEGYAL
jgi:hypothetical protein